MKYKNTFILKTVKLLSIILLYYIAGLKKMFLYVLSLSLYKIISSFFENISFKDKLSKLNNNSDKFKLFKTTCLGIIVISMFFLLFSIIVSDIISILLDINNVLLVFIFMGISIMISPLVGVMADYFVNISKNTKYEGLVYVYNLFDNVLLIIIALLVFRIFHISENIATSLLYLSKIISGLIIIIFMYLINKNRNNNVINSKNINNYKELKEIIIGNNYKNVIKIVKNSYYYISIIILYIVLSSRYGYLLGEIEGIIVFVYFYALSIIEYLIYIVKYINENLPEEMTVINRMYGNFKVMFSVTVFFSIVSPLTCKLLFYNNSYAIYLSMINIMTIFILLYDITFENIKNKKVIYISLILGIVSKLVLIIPLINAFYRMGYNLVYGDILSSVIGMLLSIVINYIYIRNTTGKNEKYFEKILDVLFDNILLCIILIIVQFIVPMDTNNYFKTLGIFCLYLLCLYGVVKVIFIKMKKKK